MGHRDFNAAPFQSQRRCWLASALGASLAGSGLLTGCATRQPLPGAAPGITAGHVQPFSGAMAGGLPAGWHPFAVRRDLRATRYATVGPAGRRVLHAHASASATGLNCPVQIDPSRTGKLSFSWRVRDVPDVANVAEAELDDCPARLVLAFGGDDTRLTLRDRLFYEQVELFTGHRLPYATLMYVWDGGHHAVGSVHRNHRTQRIQYLTVESGGGRSGQWLHYERDVAADFQRVFGEKPGPIVSVGVLTDADALKLDLEAWYGDISIHA